MYCNEEIRNSEKMIPTNRHITKRFSEQNLDKYNQNQKHQDDPHVEQQYAPSSIHSKRKQDNHPKWVHLQSTLPCSSYVKK